MKYIEFYENEHCTAIFIKRFSELWILNNDCPIDDYITSVRNLGLEVKQIYYNC